LIVCPEHQWRVGPDLSPRLFASECVVGKWAVSSVKAEEPPFFLPGKGNRGQSDAQAPDADRVL